MVAHEKKIVHEKQLSQEFKLLVFSKVSEIGNKTLAFGSTVLYGNFAFPIEVLSTKFLIKVFIFQKTYFKVKS